MKRISYAAVAAIALATTTALSAPPALADGPPTPGTPSASASASAGRGVTDARRAARAGFALLSSPGSTAFGAADPKLLRRYGYVENEYTVTGEACRYRITAPLAVAQVVDCGHPYTTRMLVRQPAKKSHFNGTALVEWTNTSTGHDVDFAWSSTHAYQMRKGYAAISLSAQVQGVKGLQDWNPERYGHLDLSASPTDPETGTDDLAGASGAYPEVLSFDVLTQTVRGLRHPGRHDPVRGKVKRVVAVGQSQSAGRLTDYYNSIDPLYKAVDGVVFYDAAGGLRTDSSTKAISVASELGIRIGNTLKPLDTENTRRWEVAGASHNTTREAAYFDPMILRDGWIKGANGRPTTLTATATGCSQSPAWTSVPTGYVLDSAIDHVVSWAKGGEPAPAAPVLVRDPKAPPIAAIGLVQGTLPGYAVDARGLTRGGIQLAEYVYSTAVNKGAGTTGPGVCQLTGMHRYYSDAELITRYPDPKAYLDGAKKLIRSNVDHGYLLRSDANRSLADAKTVYRKLRTLQGR